MLINKYTFNEIVSTIQYKDFTIHCKKAYNKDNKPLYAVFNENIALHSMASFNKFSNKEMESLAKYILG